MTVRTRWLVALVIAPVLWGVACHDDGPRTRAIPPAGAGTTSAHH